jgi:putative tryptophan/tyrosine transport system substrate-binding protein
MSYGDDFAEEFREAAGYIDRILRGSKVAELPIQQPTKFELLINMKAAKALGLNLSSGLLSTVDEVIE